MQGSASCKIMLNIVDYIIQAYKQKICKDKPFPKVDVISLDGIDYCNRVLEETKDQKYSTVPALIIGKENKSELIVNTTALTGPNRFFSTEVFLSVLARKQIEESENFKEISDAKGILSKKRFFKGLEIVKTFAANVMSLHVMDVLFEDDNYSYDEKSIKKIKEIMARSEDRTSVLCYMLAKIKVYNNGNAHSLLSDMPPYVTTLYDSLSQININEKINKKDIKKISKLVVCD